MAGSIFKEVTFTPQVFSKKFTLLDPRRRLGRLIQILESIQDNGSIIGIDRKEWIDEINSFIEGYDDDDKMDLQKQLENLAKRNRIVTFPQKFDRYMSEEEWIDQANLIHKTRALDLMIATFDNDFVKKIDTIDSSVYRNSGAKIIVQTQENMRDIIAPVLAYAEIATIIDPYFNLSKSRYEDALKVVCESLGNKHGIRQCAIIDIHTSVKILTDKNDIFDWKMANSWISFVERYEKLYGHTITIHVWEDRKSENEWHDRWIVTNQCGITIGKGSDISNWTDSTWGILDWSELPGIINKFNPNRDIYSHIGIVNSSGISKDKRAKNQVKSADELTVPKETVVTPGGLRIKKNPNN